MKVYARDTGDTSRDKSYQIRCDDILKESTMSIKVACGQGGKFPQRFSIDLPKSQINLRTGAVYRFRVPGWLRDKKGIGDSSLDDIIQTW